MDPTTCPFRTRRALRLVVVAALAAGGAAVTLWAANGRAARDPSAADAPDPLAADVADVLRLERDKPPGAAEALARTATEHAHPTLRQRAIEALGRFEPPQRQALLAGARDEVFFVRATAATALGRCGQEPEVLAALATLMNADTIGLVRSNAVSALAAIGTPAAAEALLQTVPVNVFPPIRQQALAAADALLGLHRPGGADPWPAGPWESLRAQADRVRPEALPTTATAPCDCHDDEHSKGAGHAP